MSQVLSPTIIDKTHRRILVAIIVAYVALASLYSVITPIFEASDELWHYPMVEHLATNGLALPVQNSAAPGLWRQEGSQPPLYYWLAALITAPINTSDLERVRRINPHADIGLVRPDGNVNMIVHRPDAETFLWRGTALAVHITRFFSVALGLGTVLCTYGLARALFPEIPNIALGAAAFNAFLPMFLFISGSVNNDNLSNLLGNLLTLLIVRLIGVKTAPRIRDYIFIGMVCGAGLLAKLNIGFLIPFVAFALLIVSIRLRSPRPFILGGFISGALTLAIAGGWYLRNFQLYGDPTGLNIFLDTVGRRAIPANAAQLWAERHSFTQAFWGFFGGVNVPIPETIYLLLNLVGGLALMSAIFFLLFDATQRRWREIQLLQFAIVIGWITVTFVSYLRWTSETPASQGRLVFGALSAICTFFAYGLLAPFPTRWQHLRTLLMTLAASALFGLAIYIPFSIIAPTYAKPSFIPAIPETIANFRAAEGGAIGLQNLGIAIETPIVQPGEYVRVSMNWQIEEAFMRDWSLFAHLLTPEGVIIAQRDVYPGNGRLATSDMNVGEAWMNTLAIPVPNAAYAPMTLQVAIGWYHLGTGERLTFENAETVTIGTVNLVPRESELSVPNPISIDFEEGIELVGYALSTLNPSAGERIDLTLFWQSDGGITRDYVVFVHVIEPSTQTIYARSDAMPAAWTQSTTTWELGQVIEDTHMMTVDANAPPGIYELEIGLYRQEDGFPRLRVIAPDGGMADNYAYLSRVRIFPNEAIP